MDERYFTFYVMYDIWSINFSMSRKVVQWRFAKLLRFVGKMSKIEPNPLLMLRATYGETEKANRPGCIVDPNAT